MGRQNRDQKIESAGQIEPMTQSAQHRSRLEKEKSIQWDENSPLTMSLETREGPISTRHGRFVGGVSNQVEVVEIDTGAVRVMVLPTRGMSIWYMESAGTRFGWESPVVGPVHPSLVPVFDPTGIGWLEGFDELLVRCGLESNGAPEFNAQHQLIYPLHGRIGNLPADSLSIEYDEASGRLELIGEVCESKLFFKNLRLRSRLRVRAGRAQVDILDDVTNELSTPATIQLLYHINLGLPLLGEGATLEAPIKELAPKDSLSAGEIDQWNSYPAPESGYSERVYFGKLLANDSNETTALLKSADGDKGFAVNINTTGLPRFILWKNAGDENDGYVTGIEPATNYPNARSYEADQGRVVEIAPGETSAFRLSLKPLTTPEAVKAVSTDIAGLAGDEDAKIHSQPRPGWTPGA